LSITVFLAPWLQPVTQSPHSVQAACSTPAALGPAVKVTLMGGRTDVAWTPAAARRRAASLVGSGQLSG
jgi:hypothetical protein